MSAPEPHSSASESRWQNPAAVAITTPATTVAAAAMHCTEGGGQAPAMGFPGRNIAACIDDQREHQANDANSVKSREHIRPADAVHSSLSYSTLW